MLLGLFMRGTLTELGSQLAREIRRMTLLIGVTTFGQRCFQSCCESAIRCVFTFVAPVLLINYAIAETVRLNPVADTTLFETAPTNNLGRVISLASGTTARSKRSRALLRFDLTGAIPSNATVLNVSLVLSVVRAPSGGGGVDSIFGVHRVLRGWNEGMKSSGSLGAPAAFGETTWLARSHPSDLWSEPGAAAPVDYVTEATSLQ